MLRLSAEKRFNVAQCLAAFLLQRTVHLRLRALQFFVSSIRRKNTKKIYETSIFFSFSLSLLCLGWAEFEDGTEMKKKTVKKKKNLAITRLLIVNNLIKTSKESRESNKTVVKPHESEK